MKKQKVTIAVVFILFFVGLCGCFGFGENGQSSEENRFVGTWIETSSDKTFVFLSDGDCTGFEIFGIGSCTYEIKDGKLVVSTYADGTEFTNIFDYTFSDNDNKVTLNPITGVYAETNGTLVLIKQ